ncbi:S8 family serine peptidase [Paraglaciecola sp. 2405UD69-4]|uniref:S8 family serine peptidase n=1 Tax=Paraglaciecola sp. 2405UD69-4 TaxID=3391836 RepID=UPI0039C99275
MFKSKIIILTSVVFCQFAQAQLVNPRDLTGSLGSVVDRVTRVEDKVVSKIDPPFTLSELPAIETLVTTPLEALPDILTIADKINTPLFTEVLVENDWRAVKQQWILLSDIKTETLLLQLGAKVQFRKQYSGLGLTLIHFEMPPSLDSKKALATHLPEEAMASLDRNHIYQTQSQDTMVDGSPIADSLASSQNQAFCDDPVKIGMVDSAINVNHPAFAGKDIKAKSFLPASLTSPSFHGSAVAGIMVGNIAEQPPLLVKAELFSAEVFYRQSDYAQGATLEAIVAGVDWLIRQGVKVVNMSLAGPDNLILEQVLNAVVKKGVVVVAAAGNKGPAAAPLFPAAYESVIAVSAIDKKSQPYRWSNRGAYIDFAADGVNVLTVRGAQEYATESGTSMAAPVVSAAISCVVLKSTDAKLVTKELVFERMSRLIQDMGPEGRDPIYGLGAVLRPYSNFIN